MREPVTETPEGEAVLRGGTASLAFAVITNKALRKTVRSFVATVFKRFFFDQFIYGQKLSLRAENVPAVRNVEHPLDATIPVRYEAVGVYLTFVQLWISALSYLRRRIGPSFDTDVALFIADLGRCYADAASVYSRCLSTTRRPPKAPSPRLAFIYAVDPHLFCVPSLHVLVVCYTYKRLEDLLRARGALVEFGAELASVRSRAIAITESILYVRQHSVNCIPTALAMLSVILPSYDEAEAEAFLSALFVNDGDIPEEGRKAVLSYMLGLYGSIKAAGPGKEGLYEAIGNFVISYEEMDTSFPASATRAEKVPSATAIVDP